MDVEKFIRNSAASGLSRTATAAALGMGFEKFCAVLQAIPDMQWPARGQSVDERRCRAALRGTGHPAFRANLIKARAARRLMELHRVRGVEGTIPELIAHFGLSISHSSVRRRRREGASLEAALFAPPIPPALRRSKKVPMQLATEPPRVPLSAWERVDLEFAGTAPQCM